MLKDKRKRIVIYIVGIYIVFNVFYIIFETPWNAIFTRTETPEEAIAQSQNIKVSDVVETIEYNDIALTICNNRETPRFNFVAKDEKGWIPRSSSSTPIFEYLNFQSCNNIGVYFDKDFTPMGSYEIGFRYFYGKYLVTIYNYSIIENINKDEVSDNMSSEFKYYNYVDSMSNNTKVWFTVLDEKPDQYSVKVGDEVTEIIK